MEREASSFAASRDSALAASLPGSRFDETNAALRDVERALTRPAGLRSRPWYRNLIYVADENNGYANMTFPSVNEAIRAGDERLVMEELSDLARRFDDATRALTRAHRALARSRDGASVPPDVSTETRLRLSSRQPSGLPIASPRKPEREGRLRW
jgi:N-acetylated-alpha-linked acidic dipeptidase